MKIDNNAKINKILYVIIAILVILFIIVLIAFAWAAYRTMSGGDSSAQVAKWSFNIVDGNVETVDVLDFPITRTDNNSSVQSGKIAPGTSGFFEIDIDARGSETILNYIISINLTDRPENLKFYSDEKMNEKDEIEVVDNKLVVNGFLSLYDTKSIQPHYIYWNWPLETGTTEEEIFENNLKDSEYLGKTIKMSITVNGFQVTENQFKTSLASLAKVGDYVNYVAPSGETYTAFKADTGMQSDQSYKVQSDVKWRILSANPETGTVTLMAENPINDTLSVWGKPGYKNFTTILDNICALYGNGEGAERARSITLQDVEQYSNYDVSTYVHTNWNNKKIGDTNTYSEGTFIEEDGVTEHPAPFTAAQTQYRYDATGHFDSQIIYDMIFKNSTGYKNSYYLATRATSLFSIEVNYGIYAITEGWVQSGPGGTANGYQLYLSGSRTNSTNLTSRAYVMPVIELKAGIETYGKNEDGVWELKVN